MASRVLVEPLAAAPQLQAGPDSSDLGHDLLQPGIEGWRQPAFIPDLLDRGPKLAAPLGAGRERHTLNAGQASRGALESTGLKFG